MSIGIDSEYSTEDNQHFRTIDYDDELNEKTTKRPMMSSKTMMIYPMNLMTQILKIYIMIQNLIWQIPFIPQIKIMAGVTMIHI